MNEKMNYAIWLVCGILAGALLGSLIHTSLYGPPSYSDIQTVVSEYYNTSDHNKEIDCLALNAYHEARGEGAKGQLAVSEVVMNRVQEGDVTACEVIYEKKGKSCQFSWVCTDAKVDDPELYDIIRERMRNFYINRLLREEFSEDKVIISDSTSGATFYHSRKVRPYWVTYFTRTAKIGNHLFYREDA